MVSKLLGFRRGSRGSSVESVHTCRQRVKSRAGSAQGVRSVLMAPGSRQEGGGCEQESGQESEVFDGSEEGGHRRGRA